MRRMIAAAAALALLPTAAVPPPLAAEARSEDVSWSLSGEARFRPEWRDDRDLDAAADDDMRQGFMRLRLGIAVSIRDDYRVVVQAQDSRVAGEEPSTAANQRNVDLHQGYLEWRDTGVTGLSLTIGRQEWTYGEQRLIGNFGWDNVGRSFDGAKVSWARGRFLVDGLLARISNSAVPSTASGGQLTVGSDLYGVEAQASPRRGAEYGGYWLAFGDNVDAPGEAADPNDPRTWRDTFIHAFGARMKDRFGRFDVNVEAALQRGSVRGDDLEAAAFAAQAGFNCGETVKARTFAGYDLATGDEDPDDGKRGEFFNFFPTNHQHYGYADLEGWRNLVSPYAGVSVSWGRQLAQAKAHRFLLEEAAGPWKDAAGSVMGADPAGSSGRSVGSEVDLTYRFAVREKASVEAGWSRFEPGRFARLTRGPDASRWAYLMLTIGF